MRALRTSLFSLAAGLGCCVVAWAQTKAPSLDIHYVPTPTAVVETMLRLARITPQDVVYDLGSGDGRIVIAAAKEFGARGVGVELDPELVKRARAAAQKAGVQDLVTFSQADLFTTDLSPATVVTLYLSPSINLRLESKLKRELRPGSRIVSHRFPIGNWTPDQDVEVERTHVFYWALPGRIQ